MEKLKILVMGLENSGKTSIVLNRYKKDTNLLSYLSLKPTKKIDITNISEEGKNVSIWDFGGQMKYRESYVKKMDQHLATADEIIYVVDIQDKKKHKEALTYFQNIIESLKKLKIKPELLLFLHKYDPRLEEKDPTINKEFIDQITKDFITSVPENMSFEIFKTSIYTFFRMQSYFKK